MGNDILQGLGDLGEQDLGDFGVKLFINQQRNVDHMTGNNRDILYHRFITIQIEHQMSSFKDLGVFVLNNPEVVAQRSYAHAAFNVKTEKEHARNLGFCLRFIVKEKT